MSNLLQNLNLLIVDDNKEPERMDLLKKLPAELIMIHEWCDFLQKFHDHDIPDFQLLVIDFKFEMDSTSPPFVKNGGRPDDYRDALYIDQLAWSPHLSDRNSGILIGASAIAMSAYKDLPVGAATYTGTPEIAAKDMTTTMLVSQILAGCGVQLGYGRTNTTLEGTVRTILDGARNAVTAIAPSILRFRNELSKRARIPSKSLHLQFDLDSINYLLNVFQESSTKEQLHKNLNKRGLEIRDRHGKVYHFSIPSLFLDLLLVWEPGDRPNREVWDVREHLPLSAVKPGGEIYEFIKQLPREASIREISDYLDPEQQTKMNVRDRFPGERFTHLVTLFCAWISCFMEKCTFCLHESWDPVKNKSSEEDEYCSLPTQLDAVLRILKNVSSQALPLKSRKGRSISREIASAVEHVNSHVLYRPLRFHEQNSSVMRARGIDNLVKHLVYSDCVEVTNSEEGLPCYRYVKGEPKMNLIVSNNEIASRIGYFGTKSHNNVYRIFTSMGIEDHGDISKRISQGNWPETIIEPCREFVYLNYDENDILSFLPEWLHRG